MEEGRKQGTIVKSTHLHLEQEVVQLQSGLEVRQTFHESSLQAEVAVQVATTVAKITVDLAEVCAEAHACLVAAYKMAGVQARRLAALAAQVMAQTEDEASLVVEQQATMAKIQAVAAEAAGTEAVVEEAEWKVIVDARVAAAVLAGLSLSPVSVHGGQVTLPKHRNFS